MEEKIFLKKYLGEITLNNGEHVKFLFPVSETIFKSIKTESDNLYKKIYANQKNVHIYSWAILDNLNPIQFQIVYANIKKYGENYWKRLWENRNKK